MKREVAADIRAIFNAATRHDAETLLTQAEEASISGFNLSELADLCFRIGVNIDGLQGENLPSKSRELVTYCQRREKIPELINEIKL